MLDILQSKNSLKLSNRGKRPDICCNLVQEHERRKKNHAFYRHIIYKVGVHRSTVRNNLRQRTSCDMNLERVSMVDEEWVCGFAQWTNHRKRMFTSWNRCILTFVSVTALILICRVTFISGRWYYLFIFLQANVGIERTKSREGKIFGLDINVVRNFDNS